MCKFHKDMSRAVATDSATGTFNPAHEAVIRVALSRYWLERYVAGGEVIDGYSPYPMATLSQQAAFAASGLKKSLQEVERETAEGIAFLKSCLTQLEQDHDPLTEGKLGLPFRTARDAFLDKAILDFYHGDPKSDFQFATAPGEEMLAPLYQAVAFFQNDEQTRNVLERMVTGRICTLYSAAPHQVNQAVMRTYERLPERIRAFLQKTGEYGGNILMGGFSGIAGHGVHYGAVLGAGAASGMASSANFALSGVFLAASYGIWDRVFGGRYRSRPEKRNAFIVQAFLTAAVALTGQALMEHHHSGTANHQNHNHAARRDELQKRVDTLIAQASPQELKNWQDTARTQGWTLREYLEKVCVTPQAQKAVIEQKKGQNPPVRQPE